jgi:hypothetical protein
MRRDAVQSGINEDVSEEPTASIFTFEDRGWSSYGVEISTKLYDTSKKTEFLVAASNGPPDLAGIL